MTRRRRRYPKWSKVDVDQMRAMHERGETLALQQRILRDVVRANQPWWLRWRRVR